MVGSDATLRFSVHDVLGNVVSTPQAAIVVNGGTVTNAGGQFNTLGPLTLNGGVLTGSGGAMQDYQMYRLAGTVTVSADAVISGIGTYSGIHLAAPTTIDVAADATLSVYARLINQTASQFGPAGLTKLGAGTLALYGLNTFSGDMTISDGTVNAAAGQDILNATQGALGNPQAIRSIAVGSDATLRFAAHDVLGNAASTPQAAIVINGGTVTNAGAQFNTFGPLTLNGGVLTGSGGVMDQYQMYRLAGTVTVSDDATISGSGTYSGIHLAAPTVFNVAAETTLAISARLIDQTPSQAGPASLYEAGAGAVVLTGQNAFSGGIIKPTDRYLVSLSSMITGETAGASTGSLSPSAFIVAAQDWLADWRSAVTANVTGSVSSDDHSANFPGSGYFRVDTAGDLQAVPGNSLVLPPETKLIVWEGWTDFDWDDNYWIVNAEPYGSINVTLDYQSPFVIDDENFVEMTEDGTAVYASIIPFQVTASLATGALESATVYVYRDDSSVPLGSFIVTPGATATQRFELEIHEEGEGLAQQVKLTATVVDSLMGSPGDPFLQAEADDVVFSLDLSFLDKPFELTAMQTAVFSGQQSASQTAALIDDHFSDEFKLDLAHTFFLQDPSHSEEEWLGLINVRVAAVRDRIETLAGEAVGEAVMELLEITKPRIKIHVGDKDPGKPVVAALASAIPEAKTRGLEALLDGEELEDRLDDLFDIEFARPEEVFLAPVGAAMFDFLKSGDSLDFDSIVDEIRQQPLIKKVGFELPLRFGEEGGVQGHFSAEARNLTAQLDVEYELFAGLRVAEGTELFGLPITKCELNATLKGGTDEPTTQGIQFTFESPLGPQQ